MYPTFDLDHLQQIHWRLFQDVYPWAGETRTVQISRPGGPGFFDWEAITEGYGEIQDRLEGTDHLRGATRAEFIEEAAQVYSAVNTVHAFREGNGRTQREWVNDLARGAGYELDWSHVHGSPTTLFNETEKATTPSCATVLDTITPPGRTPVRTAGPTSTHPAAVVHSHVQDLNARYTMTTTGRPYLAPWE